MTQMYRQMARQLIKLMHGVKPADIPVEQSTVHVRRQFENGASHGPGIASDIFGPRRRGDRVKPKHPLGPPMTLGNMRALGVSPLPKGGSRR